MRSNVKGILKGASLLALGLTFMLPTTAVAQDRHDRREQRREERREERRGREWGNYGGWGGSQELRQTALNAGYNNGIKAGRNDQRKGRRFNFTDEGDYRNASKDYSSRLGNKSLYQRFFRQGYENGYRDGWNGY